MLYNNNEFKGLVAYTDGGARPNPGYSGWGAHGYIYSDYFSNTKGTGLSTHYVTQLGYIPVSENLENINANIVKPLFYLDFTGSIDSTSTNNYAELTAVIEVINYVLSIESKDNYDGKLNSILIYTDSGYVEKGINLYLNDWHDNNWKRVNGELIMNYLLWKKIYNGLNKLKENNISFTINWVKGHSDSLGNKKADLLATIGLVHSMRDEFNKGTYDINNAEGYWKKDYNKHPLISHKRLYFNTDLEYSKPGRYYLAENKDEEYTTGNKTPENSYSIVFLNEPEPVLESIINYQSKVCEDINQIVLMRLNRVFDKNVYSYINQYGDKTFLVNQKTLNINFADNEPLTLVQNPPFLLMRATKHYDILHEILESFLDKNKVSKTFNYCFQDITEYFYDSNKKNNLELKKEYKVGFTKLEVTILDEDNKILVALYLGIDTLPRNNLKRIETLEPKIYLAYWKENMCYRYCTIITTNEGIGIWSSFYSNLILNYSG